MVRGRKGPGYLERTKVPGTELTVQGTNGPERIVLRTNVPAFQFLGRLPKVDLIILEGN